MYKIRSDYKTCKGVWKQPQEVATYSNNILLTSFVKNLHFPSWEVLAAWNKHNIAKYFAFIPCQLICIITKST